MATRSSSSRRGLDERGCDRGNRPHPGAGICARKALILLQSGPGAKMRIELNFGRGTLPVDFAGGLELTVIRKPAMPVLIDAPAAVRAALAGPVGARPLIE